MTAQILSLSAFRATRLNRQPPCPDDERAAWLELTRRRIARIAAAVETMEDLSEALECIRLRMEERT